MLSRFLIDRPDCAGVIAIILMGVGTLQDPIGRLPGVGQVQPFGTQSAMRICLKGEASHA
jgi:hypothetical protein